MAVQKKLYTVDEFEEFIYRPENADRLFELIDGEIVEKMPTERHGIAVRNFLFALHGFVKPRGLGRVVAEVRYRVPDDEHNARVPDVSFTSKDRLLPVVEEGAVPLIPDLCVEVQSPNDSPRTMRDKAAYYLANGARLVWLVYPKKRMVEVLYPNGEFDIFSEGETLSGGEVVPGFTMAVQDVFEE
jgi:Uma2 family endonuclease